jgi:hypothetical protein
MLLELDMDEIGAVIDKDAAPRVHVIVFGLAL